MLRAQARIAARLEPSAGSSPAATSCKCNEGYAPKDVFAGVATLAGGVWADADKCVAAGGGENGVTNVLNVHGDGDLTVPIGGGVNFAGVPFPSADQTVDTFARKFGCDALPREVAAADDGDDFSLPSDGRRDVDVSVTKFEGCGADGAYVV